jgi:uncharacterized protein
MRIDGHAHASGDFLYGENIIRILDENEVDYVILAGSVQLESKKNENLSIFSNLSRKYPFNFIYIINAIISAINTLNCTSKKLDLGNQYVFDLVRQYPNRMIQFYWANPEDNNVIEKLNEAYIKYHYRGLKLHQCITNFDIKSESMNAIVKWAEEKEMPVFIHLCSKKDVIAMVEFIRTHENVNFIIGHLIGLEIFIDCPPKQPNVFFDISCYQIVSEAKIKLALEMFGHERIVMGSDTPYGEENLKEIISLVQKLNLSDSEKEMILGGNLQKILKIDS